MRKTVVSTFTPVSSDEIATSAIPPIHRSTPTPGEKRGPDSGGYAYQPIAAPVPAVANDDSSTRSPPEA
jgi:hypothetical protein